jgi:hypothetical protein
MGSPDEPGGVTGDGAALGAVGVTAGAGWDCPYDGMVQTISTPTVVAMFMIRIMVFTIDQSPPKLLGPLTSTLLRRRLRRRLRLARIGLRRLG